MGAVIIPAVDGVVKVKRRSVPETGRQRDGRKIIIRFITSTKRIHHVPETTACARPGRVQETAVNRHQVVGARLVGKDCAAVHKQTQSERERSQCVTLPRFHEGPPENEERNVSHVLLQYVSSAQSLMRSQ
jgi:ribosomal protein S18